MNNAVMGFLVVIQFLITMLFYPLKIGAYGHVSLARDKIDLNLTVLGLSVARIRVKREDRQFRVFINGKPYKPTKKMSVKQLKNVSRQYKIEGLRIRGNMLALVGAHDAKTTAMICAGIYGIAKPIMNNFNIYTAIATDAFEIDGRLKIKINVLQIISLLFAGMRGSNG